MRTLIWVSCITTFLFITVLFAQAALDPNLILYFTFEEQLDGRQVEDMSGGGNNGKLRFGAKITNEPAEVRKGVGALKLFNNVSAQLRVDEFDRMDKYGDNSYAFWLYIFNPMGARSSILKKANVLVGEEKGSAPGIFLSDPNLALEYKFDDQGAIGLGPVKGKGFELETWYHIAGVKKASDLTIYIDGERKGNFKVKRDFNQGKGQLRIGGTTSRAASFAMDEFQMYDRPLTEKEVALIFKGVFLSVESQAKLTTTWGRLKTGR